MNTKRIKQEGGFKMKKILSISLAIMLLLSGLSAFAVGIPDFNTWLAEQVGDAQLSTTQSFLDALDKYNISHTFLGALSDGSEYITIQNYDEANNLSYTLNTSFSPDLGSATITVLDLLSFEPDAYSIAMDVCKAIYADYGKLLFVPNETENTISFAYTVDLSECENVGIQVLAVIIDITEIIANEYGRFVSIINNGTEFENTPTPQPTETPEPTATVTIAPTPIPEIASTPTVIQVTDKEIIDWAKAAYDDIKTMWPTSYDLTKEAKVYSASNINVVSCSIGKRYSSNFATVLFKGNFSGYDEYGMYAGKYTFTAEVSIYWNEWGFEYPNFINADFNVKKA